MRAAARVVDTRAVDTRLVDAVEATEGDVRLEVAGRDTAYVEQQTQPGLKLLKKDKVINFKPMFLMHPMHKDEEITLLFDEAQAEQYLA